MNLSHHAPQSLSDPQWIDQATSTMGEAAFWQYVSKVYSLLDKLEVGQSIPVDKWVKPESFDLFIKIACFYVSESECCYQFNQEYTIIKRNFDAREMEETLAVFRTKRRQKEIGDNVGGTESRQGGIETLLTPQSAIQGKPG